MSVVGGRVLIARTSSAFPRVTIPHLVSRAVAFPFSWMILVTTQLVASVMTQNNVASINYQTHSMMVQAAYIGKYQVIQKYGR